MILKNKNKKHVSDSINLIPMINLVFLLLIFFSSYWSCFKKRIDQIIRPFSIYGLQNEVKEKELSFTVLGSQIFLTEKNNNERFRKPGKLNAENCLKYR